MGKLTGFLEYERALPESRDLAERIKDSKEIYKKADDKLIIEQAARCMDCGVPFCHTGCPLGNNIPEFNDAAYREDWESAYHILKSTNNFPEFTGRICPAPCESSCVLAINKPAVAIEFIEKSIIEKAFELGIVKPQVPSVRTGKRIAVVGSGPAGLAAADQLNQAGHEVTVFERADRIGGLLRYGIPDFKMEKNVLDRRLALMKTEGIIFRTCVDIGKDISASELSETYDAIVLCIGSTVPRDLKIPNREAKGVHFAMEFLTQQNKSVAGESLDAKQQISAKDKNVIVIGGGDTGSDCIGTSNRQGAKSIYQIELLEKPPHERDPEKNPWPQYEQVFKVTSSHEEGCERSFATLTKSFIKNKKGELIGLQTVDIRWVDNKFEEVEGSEKHLPADLVLLAIGYERPEAQHIFEQLELPLNDRGMPIAKNYQTKKSNIFVAGDMRRGQSLVVWAISEGREAARAVDLFLMGESELPSKTLAAVAFQ
ncbi:MAG: glutamate synthase subunit beta [Bernardetiaceae bacterium]|nr:glutamate synthase subunit beta [Bernardetiaceae bacterium]